MRPWMDDNAKNESTPKPTGHPKLRVYPVVGRERLQRKGCFPTLMRNITSAEMMLFIISLMMILLGGYILLRPQFTKSTLMDLVDEKLETELHMVESTLKDMRQKMQSSQEDRAHLEMLIKHVNASLVILGSAVDYNITELGLKLEKLNEKNQLQDIELKDLEEKGRHTHKSLDEFVNNTRETVEETRKQQLLLRESLQQVNESVISLTHDTHTNITVQHNSTYNLTERMNQAEEGLKKFTAAAEHLQRIDHTVAQLVSSGSIPTSSLIIIISVLFLLR